MWIILVGRKYEPNGIRKCGKSCSAGTGREEVEGRRAEERNGGRMPFPEEYIALGFITNNMVHQSASGGHINARAHSVDQAKLN